MSLFSPTQTSFHRPFIQLTTTSVVLQEILNTQKFVMKILDQSKIPLVKLIFQSCESRQVCETQINIFLVFIKIMQFPGLYCTYLLQTLAVYRERNFSVASFHHRNTILRGYPNKWLAYLNNHGRIFCWWILHYHLLINKTTSWLKKIILW